MHVKGIILILLEIIMTIIIFKISKTLKQNYDKNKPLMSRSRLLTVRCSIILVCVTVIILDKLN